MAKNLFLQKKFTASPSAQLALMAGLSGLIYLLVFTLPFPLPRLYSTIPPVDYTKLTNYSISGFIGYVAGLGVLFWLYLWAIQLTIPAGGQGGRGAGGQRSRGAEEELPLKYGGRRSAVGGRLILIVSAALAVILLFSYPVTAIDLFIYAIRTRGWALYGLNPLTTAPETLPTADPWLGLAAEWVDAPSPYGPLWEWLSLAAFHLSGGNFLNHLIALKILATLAYLGCAWLIFRVMRQIQPNWAITATIAFAWSPLVLLETVQNGHNDIIMVFFLLAAVWAMNERISEWRMGEWRINPFAHSPIRHSFICLFLALSILVKFVTVLVVPFFLLALTAHEVKWPKRLILMSGYGLLIALLVILPLLPLWPGWDNWAVLQAGSGAGRSLLALLVLGFKDARGVNFAFDFSRALLFGLYTLIYLYILVRGQKPVVSSQRSVISNLPTFQSSNLPILQPSNPPTLASSPPRLLASSFHVLFWYVLLAAPVFHAWYLLWFLPLAALLLPNRRPLIAAAVFSITALFIIPYFETVRVWYPVLLENQFLGHLIGVPLLVVPPALALLWPISRSPKSEV
ncbi:MAG: hypothetical protein HS114_17825 [Anaerolineales bacterium]|nr:hypothetical protein [Anaerolineales bacterium]